jgi:hypothetical protein
VPPPGPPPPPPGGIGIVVRGHHDWFNVFQQWEEFEIEKVVADPAVVHAIQDIRSADNSIARLNAVSSLMERIG